MLAPDPIPDWFLLDRYLAAAELQGFDAVIAFNKQDLAASLPTELETYAGLGYTTIRTSAKQGEGLDTLSSALQGKRSAMIGQSGVGKSSLLNAVLGDALQAVGELSEKSGQGRHTTSTAVLFALPDGGELIDSPGVRDYAPYIEEPRAVANGFREFGERIAQCRFQDCRHLAEPDCAIKAAVTDKEGDVLKDPQRGEDIDVLVKVIQHVSRPLPLHHTGSAPLRSARSSRHPPPVRSCS